MAKKSPGYRYCLLMTLALLWAGAANAIQITEIMYNPKVGKSSDEFIELYNETAARRDIGGWKFINGIDFTFPEGTVIEPRSYFIVASNPKRHKLAAPVFGPFRDTLRDQNGRLTLVDLAGGFMADVKYKTGGLWPVSPDGTGHSLSKVRPRVNPDQPENWRASLQMGGTPGKDNGLEEAAQKPVPVVVNEIFASQDRQFIEIYNRLSEPFDLSGYWISNVPNKLKSYRVPDGTIIPPHGYFSCVEPGFELVPGSGWIFVTIPDGTQVTEACEFKDIKENIEMSRGRHPDGSGEWYAMPPSPGEKNSVNLNTSVVINEIMYHPPSDSDDDEYVELYNRGKAPVDLTGWRIADGISFEFPDKTIIPPDGYLVIAKSKAHLLSKYGLNPHLVLGDYKGRLSNGEEIVRLHDNLGNQVDEVHYYDDGHWSKYADGYGSSLELIDPYHDNSNYQAWEPSDEAKKAKWTHISYADSCRGIRSARSEFHCHLLEAGEMLIDDIRFTPPKTSLADRAGRQSREIIANGSFESGLRGWMTLGNHIRSHVVNTGSQHGKRCLKLVASGAGNTAPNHVETSLQTSLKSGETYTISFWAKWQRGSNLLVTRCLGNQLPETHRIPIPELTGTPGKRNSVYRPNLGPIFRDVRHSPVVPGPGDTVHIAAGVYDPDGISSVTLYYKPDRASSYSQIEMYDDGKHSDGAANDGVYGGDIPKNPARQTVAFYIKAKDKKNRSNSWPRDLETPGLYRIEKKAMKSDLPTYRIIMTAEDARELKQRISLSNEPLNATFIFNERDVYYQVTCRYTGSPHRRGRRSFSGYKVRFNNDEKLHGVKRIARFDRNDNSPGGYYNERISYDLLRKMGVPTCEQEWVHVRFNGRETGLVWEDILPPGKRYLSIFYPDDSDGELYELYEQFTFYGRPEETSNFDARAANFNWLGTDKELYRWNFLPRSHKRRDDFSHVIQLVKTMNSPTDDKYEDTISETVNVSSWLKMMAVRAMVSDWDFIGTNTGKNCYVYRSNKTEKWDMLSWDNEWGFEQTNMQIWASPWVIRRFQESPGHRHLYLSYIQELMDKYFNVEYLEPWFRHYHDIVNGVSPQRMSNFVRWRRQFLSRIIPKARVKITNCRRTGNESAVELRGSAPIETRLARIGGEERKLKWTNAIRWKLTIPYVKKGTKLTLEFLDYDMRVIGKDSVEI